MNLIPMPKKMTKKEDCFENTAVKPVHTICDERLLKAIEKLPVSDSGAELYVTIANEKNEKYVIEIFRNKITLNAGSERGAFYGIQTLRQIFKSGKIPCCRIEDEPDFKYRGFYHDVTRGKVPKLETLKELVDMLAYFKMNSLQLYVEHTFEFKEFADSIERTGYLTADEIRELDRYCTENYIEFIPSLATFGHLFELLIKDKYKHLAECDDYKPEQIFWNDRMDHHTIDPTNPESFELIKSLLDQYMPLFSSDKFNICCDETFDLINGKHKGMDTGKMYIDFVCKIADYLKSKGKTVMMWGDILLTYSEQIDKLPEDIILLNWDYRAEPDKKRIECIKNAGKNQIVCPGIHTWFTFCESLSDSIPNIHNMAYYGYEFGAEGLLNTSWGDYGNPCSIDLSLTGICFGAEKAWNVKSDEKSFFERIDSLVYGFCGASEHIRELSDIQTNLTWMNFVLEYSNKVYPKKLEVVLPDGQKLIEVHTRCDNLQAKLRDERWEKDEVKKELIIAVEAIMLMAEILCEQNGISVKQKVNMDDWLKKYRAAWLAKNKESELCEIEKVFVNFRNIHNS